MAKGEPTHVVFARSDASARAGRHRARLLFVLPTGRALLIDNLLYPLLVGSKLRLHALPVFVAIVGRPVGLRRFRARAGPGDARRHCGPRRHLAAPHGLRSGRRRGGGGQHLDAGPSNRQARPRRHPGGTVTACPTEGARPSATKRFVESTSETRRLICHTFTRRAQSKLPVSPLPSSAPGADTQFLPGPAATDFTDASTTSRVGRHCRARLAWKGPLERSAADPSLTSSTRSPSRAPRGSPASRETHQIQPPSLWPGVRVARIR